MSYNVPLKLDFTQYPFLKKCKVMKTLLNFYPKYYPRLSCTMIDVSAHYVIPPPQKISSYPFIVYYTKYLIFILSDLLKSIISGYITRDIRLMNGAQMTVPCFQKHFNSLHIKEHCTGCFLNDNF